MSVEIRACDLFIYWPFYEFLHGNGFVKTNIRRDAEQLRPLPAGSAVALTAENKFRKKTTLRDQRKQVQPYRSRLETISKSVQRINLQNNEVQFISAIVIL